MASRADLLPYGRRIDAAAVRQKIRPRGHPVRGFPTRHKAHSRWARRANAHVA